MIFEIGKYYRHVGTGELLHIVGEITTTMYGDCLVGESTRSVDLLPIGKTKGHAINYEEIPKNEWDHHWNVYDKIMKGDYAK